MQLLAPATILEHVPRIGAISSGSASFFCLSPSLHSQGLCPSLWLPQPLETCTSHSCCFFFSLLFPLLLPCLQGILPLPFCRPSQPIRALGLFPSKPANHTHSEISSFLLLCCCTSLPLTTFKRGAPAGGDWLSFYWGCIRLSGFVLPGLESSCW